MVAFSGCYKSIPEINQYVTQAAERAGLRPEAVYAVQLAIDEACANIIEHAYGGEGRGDIECTCVHEMEGLTIILHDHGHPFKPGRLHTPNVRTPLKGCKTRGAGLFLMRKMMDEVRFELSPDGGNWCVMVKRK